MAQPVRYEVMPDGTVYGIFASGTRIKLTADAGERVKQGSTSKPVDYVQSSTQNTQPSSATTAPPPGTRAYREWYAANVMPPLSSIPEIARLEQLWRQVWIETGRTDTPEQKAWHAQAEALRKQLNPMYPGSHDGGIDDQYILPPGNEFAGVGEAVAGNWIVIAILGVLLLLRR